MGNLENFKKLVSGEDNISIEQIKWRVTNKIWLRESKQIAFKIMDKLDEINWTQKQLAEKLNVSPQQVSKIVKGNENLTLETITKIQDILEIPLLATFYESNSEMIIEVLMGTEEFKNSGFMDTYQCQSAEINLPFVEKRA